MRVGRYEDAVASGRRAVAADERYIAQVDAQRAYRVGYVAHNHHFLWAAAAMQGRSADALAAARSAFPAACGDGRQDRSTAILQHYFVLPYFTLVRFGRWRDILEDTLPPDIAEPYALAIWHYARGTALVRTGRVDEARHALSTLDRFASDPALGRERIKNINPAEALVRIARLTLAADIAAAQKRRAEAVTLLQQATAIEDALAYDEPHLWLAPTRHALGAMLLESGRHADAERIYREDLARYPDNGWALAGLTRALRAQGRNEASKEAQQRFRSAWRNADVPLDSPRY
jgi:tetratricopeptide (TPR) repeat protein